MTTSQLLLAAFVGGFIAGAATVTFAVACFLLWIGAKNFKEGRRKRPHAARLQ